jgi:hypothetical protein
MLKVIQGVGFWQRSNAESFAVLNVFLQDDCVIYKI